MDLQTAYKIIGVEENASLEELNKRYYALTETKATIAELNDIQTAYNLIKKHIYETDTELKEPFYKNLGHYFHYYKYHIIVGIIIATLIGVFTYSFIGGQIEKKKEANKLLADIEIMVFGDYPDEDLLPLKESIQELFPEWERIELKLIFAPNGKVSAIDQAAMQTSQLTIMTARPDIIIFDVYNFNRYIDNGPFIPLDQFENELQVADQLQLYQQKNDNQKRIYGINLTDHKLFSGLEIATDEKIAVIRTDSPNKENALKLLAETLK